LTLGGRSLKHPHCAALWILSLLLVGQPLLAEQATRDEKDSHHASAPQPRPSPFLKQSRRTPPRLEWNREVQSQRGGTISFVISSQGPFAVTVITGKGYDALRRRDREAFSKSDVLLTLDVDDSPYEGKVSIPPGSSWFIIENRSDEEVVLSLECTAEQ
jgi:hypothetical protein